MMQNETVQEQEASAAETCRHHWVIESPDGPTSRGYCKLCRREREFFNDPERAEIRANTPPQPVAA